MAVDPRSPASFAKVQHPRPTKHREAAGKARLETHKAGGQQGRQRIVFAHWPDHGRTRLAAADPPTCETRPHTKKDTDTQIALCVSLLRIATFSLAIRCWTASPPFPGRPLTVLSMHWATFLWHPVIKANVSKPGGEFAHYGERQYETPPHTWSNELR